MKNKYIYIDHSEEPNNPGKIAFRCFASDILEADRLYEAKIKKDPRKQSYIGCQIHFEKSKIPNKYDQLGSAIEYHIKNYTPKNWREPIRSVFNSIPFISAKKAKSLLESYRNGELEKSLNENEDAHFTKFPCMRAAVKEFFKLKNHEEFISLT